MPEYLATHAGDSAGKGYALSEQGAGALNAYRREVAERKRPTFFEIMLAHVFKLQSPEAFEKTAKLMNASDSATFPGRSQ